MTESTFQLLWREPSIRPEFRAGVSLHSHTMYSEESLEMIPRYMGKVPWLAEAIRTESDRYTDQRGRALNFSKAFWTPPLPPRQAYRLEQKQIQHLLQLPGFVSLTDHDDIRSGSQLQVLNDFRSAPVSTEWTIPFGPTFFHLGVHNLPTHAAQDFMGEMRDYTRNPESSRLQAMLSELNALPDVLLVLNHPLWDEKGIGVPEHANVLGTLLERHRRSFHALEVNGLRSWGENQKVMWLGRQTGLPVISGGDRHGLEPNAILNVTATASFVEFIHEIRRRKTSHAVFMPQYREPLRARVLQTIIDAVRDYPENLEGRRRWADRVFYREQAESVALPLSDYWEKGVPSVVRYFLAAMRVAEFRGVRSALRFALNDGPAWSDQEAPV